MQKALHDHLAHLLIKRLLSKITLFKFTFSRYKMSISFTLLIIKASHTLCHFYVVKIISGDRRSTCPWIQS